MSLSIRSYDYRPGGGYAVVEGADLSDVSAICVENCYSGLFLDGEGHWTKARTALPVVPVPEQKDALLLGPHIVDFIPTDLQVALRTAGGLELGRIFWTDIVPSRNPGAVTGVAFVRDEARRGEAEAIARREAEERGRREAEERTRREAENLREVEERARREAEERTRREQEAARAADTQRTRRTSDRRLLWLVAIPVALAVWFAVKPVPAPVPEQREPPSPVQAPAPVQTPVQAPTQTPIQPPIERRPSVVEERPRLDYGGAPTPAAPVLVERTSQQASFECRPSMAEPAAQLICADADLALADARLGRLFRQRLNSLSPNDRRGLIAEERVWIGQRNRICGIPMAGSYDSSSLAPYKPCFLRMINQRAGELEGG